MRCPKCGKTDRTIKSGKRKTSKGIVQKNLCRRCGRYFSSSLHPYSRYPDEMIFEAMVLYNKGKSLPHINEKLIEKFGKGAPNRTLYSWIRRYVNEYGLYALRGVRSDRELKPIKRLKLKDPTDHELSYHGIKLERLRTRWPKIHRNIKKIEKSGSIPFRENNEIGISFDASQINLKGPKRSFSKIIELAEDMKGELTKKELCEFFLLHHPDCIALNFPFIIQGERDDCNNVECIDMLFLDQNRVLMVDIVDSHKEMRKKIPKMVLIRDAYIKETGIAQNRTGSLFIVDDRNYELITKTDQS